METLQLLFWLIFGSGLLPGRLTHQSVGNGYDMEELRQILVPFNVALHATITATSTCGQSKPTNICYLDTFTGTYNNSECDVCDASESTKSHPARYAIDGEDSSWISEIGPQEVNVTIDLRQHFYISSVILKIGRSLPPRNWKLEKSLDGINFSPWQYFAGSPEECEREFHSSANANPEGVEDVLCVTKQLGLKDINSEIWSDARYIRLNFLKPETFGEDIHLAPLHDDSFKRLIYYSLRDVTVLAYCICHGYSDSCTWSARRSMFVCNCTRNTCGDECTRCCDGFPQFAWKPFSTADPYFSCERCNCFGHSNECVYNQTLDKKNLSIDLSGRRRGGGMCLNCKHNTSGINCELCMAGFYRSPFSPKTEGCEDCRNCSTVLAQETNDMESFVSYTNGMMLHLYQNPDILQRRRQKSLDLMAHSTEALIKQFRKSAYSSRKEKIEFTRSSVAKVASKMWNNVYATTSVGKYSNAIGNVTVHIKTNEAKKFHSEAIWMLEYTQGLLNFINQLSLNKAILSEDDALEEAENLHKEIKRSEQLKAALKSARMELIDVKMFHKDISSACRGKKLLGQKCKKQETKLVNVIPKIQDLFQIADFGLQQAETAKQLSLRNKIIATKIKGHAKNYWQLEYHTNQSLILSFEGKELLNTAVKYWQRSFDVLSDIKGSKNALKTRTRELAPLIEERKEATKTLNAAFKIYQQELKYLQTSEWRAKKFAQDDKEPEALMNEAEAVAKSIEVPQFRKDNTKARSQLLLKQAKELIRSKAERVIYPVSETMTTKTVSKATTIKSTTITTEESKEIETTVSAVSTTLEDTGEPEYDYWEYSDPDPSSEATTKEPTTEASWGWPWGDEAVKQDLKMHDDHTGKQMYSLKDHHQRLQEYAKRVAEYQEQIRNRSKTIAELHQTMAAAMATTERRHKRFLPEYEGIGKHWTILQDRLRNLDKRLHNRTNIWKELLSNPCTNERRTSPISICVEKKLDEYHHNVEKCKTLTQSIELKRQHYQFGHLAEKISSLREKIETAKKLARRFTGPVEFSSPGFMSPVLPDVVTRLSAISQIELRVNSNYEDGWIFTSSRQNATSFFVYVRLIKSHLEICVCLDHELQCAKPSSSPLRGSWFYLSLLRIGNRVTISLIVNGSEKITESLVWTNSSTYLAHIAQPIYVGGIPESFKSMNQSLQNDFDGVMTLAINGYDVSLISANKQSGVQQFRGHSIEGMYLPETIVSFDGNGLHYLSMAYSAKPIKLHFKFRTFEDDVLLAHIQTSKKAMYVTVWINASKVHVRYNNDLQTVHLYTTGKNYNDGKWHLVEIQQMSDAWTLSLDQSDKNSVISPLFHMLGSMLKSTLMLGGIDSTTMKLLSGNLQGNLKNMTGCLANMSIGGSMLNMHNYDSSKRTTIGKCILPTSKCSCASTHQVSLKHLRNSVYLVTFTFRTTEMSSLILWYSLSRPGFISVYQNKGKMNIVVKDRQVSGRYFDRNGNLTVNDGRWHMIVLVLGERSSLIVDGLKIDFNDRLKETFYESQHKLVLGGDSDDGSRTCFKDLAVNDRVLDLSGNGLTCLQ